MSSWIRGIYNAAANFNMSGSLRAARGRTMAGNRRLMREEPNKSNQYVEPSESIEPGGITATASSGSATACTRASDRDEFAATTGSSTASSGSGAQGGERTPTERTDCGCTECRDYNEYTSYTISASREDLSTGVRISNESGHLKQANADARDRVEYCTGIPTGVTI